MTVAALPAPEPTLQASSRRIADRFPAPEPALLSSGLVLLVMAVALAILIQIDTRMVQGVSTWLKPFKFAASAGLHLVTIAFLWNWLAPRVRDGMAGAILVRLLIVSCLFEVFYIAYMGALGTRSHYNLDTPVSSAMFSLMGLMATILVVATLLAGVAVLVVRQAGADGRSGVLSASGWCCRAASACSPALCSRSTEATMWASPRRAQLHGRYSAGRARSAIFASATSSRYMLLK